jgi:hypothetical protein
MGAGGGFNFNNTTPTNLQELITVHRVFNLIQ